WAECDPAGRGRVPRGPRRLGGPPVCGGACEPIGAAAHPVLGGCASEGSRRCSSPRAAGPRAVVGVCGGGRSRDCSVCTPGAGAGGGGGPRGRGSGGIMSPATAGGPTPAAHDACGGAVPRRRNQSPLSRASRLVVEVETLANPAGDHGWTVLATTVGAEVGSD